MPSKAGKSRARRVAKMFSLSGFWHGRSVRTQLLIAIGIVNLLAAITAGGIWIYNTRSATRAEITASLEVAQRFATATVKELASQGRLDLLPERLPHDLRDLRHVRILLKRDGKLTMQAPIDTNGAQEFGWAPQWFATLIGPKLPGRAERVVSADPRNPVIIVGEPDDEIAEAWHDFWTLAVIWLTLDALILVILYIVLGRILDPLRSLSRGMQSLKVGRYGTRLKPPRVKEIARITDCFNGLAKSLDGARGENNRLYRQLITTQEQVRREIARELHDEAGACLFGIAANASSIRSFSDKVEDERSAEIRTHVGEILGSAERLKGMNRAILKRLRPGPIGQVSLSQLIDELVSGLQHNHRDTQILATVGDLAKSYGEGSDLTLYRCIQEGVTAAIRSGKAKTIYIDVLEQRRSGRGTRQGRPTLHATLRFDGSGFPASKPKDIALATIAERVRALGGSCAIRSAASKGTTIRIDIPIEDAAREQALVLG